jgi:hypothetical protein
LKSRLSSRAFWRSVVLNLCAVVVVAAVIALAFDLFSDWMGLSAVVALVVVALVLFWVASLLGGAAGEGRPWNLSSTADLVLRCLLVLAATAALILVLLAWRWLGAQLAVTLLLTALVLYLLSAVPITPGSVVSAVVVGGLLVVLLFADWPHVDVALGEQKERPRTAADLRPAYHRSVGSIVLDFRKLALKKPKTVTVHVGLGRIIVIAPLRFTVRVTSAHVGFGELLLFDQRRSRGARVGNGQIKRAGRIKKGTCAKNAKKVRKRNKNAKKVRKTSKRTPACPLTLTLKLSAGLGRVVVRDPSAL